MEIFREENGVLKVRYQGENLWLMPWGRNALRVCGRWMEPPALRDWALLPQERTAAQVEIGAEEASITVGDIRAVVRHAQDPERITLAFYNGRGELLLAERGGTGALKLRPRVYKPIPGGAVKLTVEFEAQQGERLYGMGQYQQELLDLKGAVLELAQRNSQASVPFLLSSRGYGFLWHNPAIGRVSFGTNLTQWVAEDTQELDYWICAGDTPAQIEAQYADAVGHAPRMPEYGLGFWHCKLRYWNQEQLLQVAREYHKRGVKVDVIVIDYFHWPYMGDYRFDEEFWPDVPAMVEELRGYGMKLMVSIWPQVAYQSENFEELNAQGYLVRSDRGMDVQYIKGEENVMFFDFTNPEARAWLWRKIRENYYRHGVETFWLDEAEPEFGAYDFDNYRCNLGPMLQMGNLYPQLYARAFYEGQKSEGQREAVNLLRCAWAGSARYGALVWSGDVHSTFEALRRQVCAGLNMGLAGIPWWTTDIGGFAGGDIHDPAFRELLVRWFQWGTFCPVMRLHGNRLPKQTVTRADGSPRQFSGADNEIWSYGADNERIFLRCIALRERMRDYVRQLMEEASASGAPVMRPMFFEFPDEAVCWELRDQYLFGADVLVAPMLEAGARQRSVYLPAGARWSDLHTGESFEGGQHILCDAPLERLPVFLRDGRHAEWIGAL